MANTADASTLVFLHAHPDDEALFTSGTMARASTEGHRVVLVVATSGELGLASGSFGDSAALAATRQRELEESARALGVHRTVLLGFGDSGLHGEAPVVEGQPLPFVHVPVDVAAERVAEVLSEESAYVLTTYDPAGGYGHPDHRQVNIVGARAAELAGTPILLEATVPRDTIARAVRLVGKVYKYPPEFDATSFERAYTPRGEITHWVDCRSVIKAKRASMAAHSSQATADGADRTLAAFLRLPMPVYRRVFRREWYVRRSLGASRLPSLFEPAH